MNIGSCFFCALEEKRDSKKHITCLLAEESTPLTNSVEMWGRARISYASLFSLNLTNVDACGVLWNELPMVEACQAIYLMASYTQVKNSGLMDRDG
ncbi:unnamed protein product [Caretta caretta]